jgi:dienelactone hydrolase
MPMRTPAAGLVLFVYLILIALGAGAAPPAGVRVERGIVYGHGPGQGGEPSIDLLLDAYTPADSITPNQAAVVLIHGNPGQAPYPGDRCLALAGTAQVLASRGYACFTVAYQFFGADEVKTSVRWVRANAARYSVDPNRIAAVGTSLGGSHAVTLDITDDTDDMTSLKDDPANHASRSAKVAAAVCLAGGIFQPETVDPSDGPIMFVQGTEDTVNSRDWVTQIVASCQANGLACPVYWVDKAPHSIDLQKYMVDGRAIIDLIDQFLQIYVVGNRDTEMVTLSVKVEGTGAVTYDPPFGMYTRGATVKVKAVPGPGAILSRWEGAPDASGEEITVTVDDNKHLVAHFTPTP